ncbi:MAG: enoyl-CoA hydratase [marine bacterium B5-7]|nr:MAG: enoyl-CoA hydratase [marine bacterium B5-7]
MMLNVREHNAESEYADSPTNNTVHLLNSSARLEDRQAPTFYDSEIEAETGIHWWRLRSDCPAKFTPEVVTSLRRFQSDFSLKMRNLIASGRENEVPRYHVLTSDIDGIFNLGGDLAYFYRMIKEGDRESLSRYAEDCVDLVYENSTAFELPMTTVALVKGNALGGGMEAALSASIIVAERHVRMGLPEVLFNMFPGMGAYQFLTRRMSASAAERLILSGKLYDASELYEMGVIDYLADSGKGEQEVRKIIRRERNHSRAANSFRRAVQNEHPISRDSLVRFVETWVDAAMSLEEKDLNHMRYLIRSQIDRGF